MMLFTSMKVPSHLRFSATLARKKFLSQFSPWTNPPTANPAETYFAKTAAKPFRIETSVKLEYAKCAKWSKTEEIMKKIL